MPQEPYRGPTTSTCTAPTTGHTCTSQIQLAVRPMLTWLTWRANAVNFPNGPGVSHGTACPGGCPACLRSRSQNFDYRARSGAVSGATGTQPNYSNHAQNMVGQVCVYGCTALLVQESRHLSV
jgi:hypothetical protein